MAVQFAKRPSCWQRVQQAKQSFPALPTLDLQGNVKTIKHGRYSNLYTAGARPPKLSSFEVTPRLGAPTFKRFSLK